MILRRNGDPTADGSPSNKTHTMRILAGLAACITVLLVICYAGGFRIVGFGDSLDGRSDLNYAVAYGDSTTEGDGVSAEDRWTTLLAARTDWKVDNFGANGQTSEQIAARWGSIRPVGKIRDGILSGSSASPLILDIDPVKSASDKLLVLEVELLADGKHVVMGDISSSEGTANFIRHLPGESLDVRTVEIQAVVPERQRRGLLIVGMGVNNEPYLDNGTQSLAQIEAWYRGMTRLHRGRLIVWGMLDRGIEEAPGTLRGDYIAELESWLASEYGIAFVPLRQYLSSQRALEDATSIDATFSPSSDDLLCLAAGCVPPSFRVSPGSVHLNELGHELQALLFYRYMSAPEVGWIQ